MNAFARMGLGGCLAASLWMAQAQVPEHPETFSTEKPMAIPPSQIGARLENRFWFMSSDNVWFGDDCIYSGGGLLWRLSLDSFERSILFAYGKFLDPSDPDQLYRLVAEGANATTKKRRDRWQRSHESDQLAKPTDVNPYQRFVTVDQLKKSGSTLVGMADAVHQAGEHYGVSIGLVWKTGLFPVQVAKVTDRPYPSNGANYSYSHYWADLKTRTIRPAKEWSPIARHPELRPRWITEDGRWGLEWRYLGDPSQLAVLDLFKGKLVRTIKLHGDHSGVALDPSGRRFAAYGFGLTQIHEIESGKLLRELWVNREGEHIRFARLPFDILKVQKGPRDSTLSAQSACFSRTGKYLFQYQEETEGPTHLAVRAFAIYDVDEDRVLTGLSRNLLQRFEGWGPLEHTAFFTADQGLELRDIRDGRVLALLGLPEGSPKQVPWPYPTSKRRAEEGGVVTLPTAAVFFAKRQCIASTYQAVANADNLNLVPESHPNYKYIRWDLAPHMEELRKRLEAIPGATTP